MSTAAAWDARPLQRPGRRPHLVVIEGGSGRGPSAGATSSGLSGGGLAEVVLTVPRWVRLAVTSSVAAVAVSMALGFGAGGAGAAPAPIGSVEVRSGQTLSEIARTEMPGLATAEAVARIRLANNLPSTDVTSGQVLVIPAY